MDWIKTNTQEYVSDNGDYVIAGRYTYYQGWTPYYLPNGRSGKWECLDGIYKGKGALDACRTICNRHKLSHNVA